MKKLALLLLCSCLSSTVEDTTRELCAEEIEGQVCYLRCSGNQRITGTFTVTGSETVSSLHTTGGVVGANAGTSDLGTRAANNSSLWLNTVPTANNYALSSSNNGDTTINATSGQVVTVAIANSVVGTWGVAALNVSAAGEALALGGAAYEYASAPTIGSGFGTAPSILGSNTGAFEVTVGSPGAATGVINFPTASHGWNCQCDDLTTTSATVFFTRQTASSTTSCTIGNFTNVPASGNWNNADKIRCTAAAY
jgi:hypothetical protein